MPLTARLAAIGNVSLRSKATPGQVLTVAADASRCAARLARAARAKISSKRWD